MRKNKGMMYFDDVEETAMVCPICFETKCWHNRTKVEIDVKMIPIIKKFNDSGFVTNYCCSGHMVKGETTNTLYVKFKEPLPLDFVITKRMKFDNNRTVVKPKNTRDMSYKGYNEMLLEMAKIAELNKKG